MVLLTQSTDATALGDQGGLFGWHESAEKPGGIVRRMPTTYGEPSCGFDGAPGGWLATVGPGLGALVGSADALGSAMPAAKSGAPRNAAMMLMVFFMEIFPIF